MDNYLLLKIAHSLPGLLLLLGLLAHVFMLWKAARGGDAAVLQRKLRRTRLISLPLLGFLALSLPVSGWALVNLLADSQPSSTHQRITKQPMMMARERKKLPRLSGLLQQDNGYYY